MKNTKDRPVLHLICQAHLDPVWIWPRRDGYSEALTTMGSAAQFLEAEPDMKFTRSSAAVYRWVQESDPELFHRIKALVKAGRWEIVNGWEIQPDANLPLGESFVRQALYGKQWFQKEFDVDVTIGYNVDTFGHTGNLPQILKKSGLDHYVFMRPPLDPDKQPHPLLFWWESPDGSRVLSWRLPQNYGQPPDADADFLEKEIRRAIAENFVPGINHALCFVGVGNHGGGPTRRQIDRIRQLQSQKNLPELRFSTLQEYFETVQKEPGFSDIPVHRQGLQYINVGCYAAHGRIKRANRRAERLWQKAESLETMRRQAGIPQSTNFTQNQTASWRNILFNQFHDIHGGTCIQSADTSILAQSGHAEYLAESSIEENLHRLARQVHTSWAEKGVLFLCNPLPWPRLATVSFDTFVSPTGEERITHLKDAQGKKETIQWAPSETSFGPMAMDWKNLTATVSLPAWGYRAFSLAEGQAPKARAWKNPPFQINGKAPGLTRLLNHQGENLLSQSIHFQVYEDSGDTWGHKLDEYQTVLGEPRLLDTKTVVQGPLVKTVRQNFRWKGSSITAFYTAWNGRPEVEIQLRIRWNEPRELLRFLLPTRLTQPQVRVAEPGGVTPRRSDGWEKPASEWVALEGTLGSGKRSIGLLADRPLSYFAQEGTIGVSLVRSSYYAHHHPQSPAPDSHNPYLDMGETEYRLWLVPGTAGMGSLHMHRKAWELETPAERVVDHGHPGSLPPSQGFLDLKPASLALYALKPAEKGKSLVLRFQETQGRKTTATITLPGKSDPTWTGSLNPYEIQTVLIPLNSSKRKPGRCTFFENRTRS